MLALHIREILESTIKSPCQQKAACPTPGGFLLEIGAQEEILWPSLVKCLNRVVESLANIPEELKPTIVSVQIIVS